MNVDQKLTEILKSIGKDKCPSCEKVIDRGDVAWNNASTDAGTPCSYLEIQCQRCDTEVYYKWSWWPEIDDFEEFVEVLEDEIFDDM